MGASNETVSIQERQLTVLGSRNQAVGINVVLVELRYPKILVFGAETLYAEDGLQSSDEVDLCMGTLSFLAGIP